MDFVDKSARGQDSDSAYLAPGNDPSSENLGNTVVLAPNEDGVTVLPAGATLDDIEIRGLDLVIEMTDGTTYVIVNGTMDVPVIVIDGVVVPPLNLAAYLTGEGPEPAAGAPQSSGGNFADPVGPIQDAFGLGDLLPYTELAFPEAPDEEVLPQLVNNDPNITFVPNVGDVAGGTLVRESHLPATTSVRDGESPGSAFDGNPETTTGTINFVSLDGVGSIAVNGVVLVPGQFPQTVAADEIGTLIITGLTFDNATGAGSVTYSYTLNDNTEDPESTLVTFNIELIDEDGDVATDVLTIEIIDDVPTAVADQDSVDEGGTTSGNVLPNDEFGADGPAATSPSGGVVGVRAESGDSETEVETGTGTEIRGLYGTIVLNADGSYTYTADADVIDSDVSDVFVYTIMDGDPQGDRSTTTLTIDISDITLASTDVRIVVNEAALDFQADGQDLAPGTTTGRTPASTAETVSGSIDVAGASGFAIIGSTTGTYGVIAIDSDGGFIYTLTTRVDNLPHADDGTETELEGDVFTFVATDGNGNTVQGTITVDIIDDIPVATADFDTLSEGGTAEGNVLPNDAFGADGPVTTMPSGGVIGVRKADGDTTTEVTIGTGAEIAGDYGTLVLNAGGSYTYVSQPGALTEDAVEVFVYTIEDADGDRSTTTLTLTVEDIDLVADDEQAVVYEAALDLFQTGNDLAPGTVTGSVPGSTQETATGTLNIPGATSFSITGSTTGIYGLISIDDAGNYVYTLTSPVDNLPNANDGQDTELAGDVFTYAASDANGNTVQGTITVDIIDDIPVATADFDTLSEGGTAEGNVLPNDAFGADGPVTTMPSGGVIGVRKADGDTTTEVTIGTGAEIAGDYGTLVLNAGGSYTYVSQPGALTEDAVEVFVYTIEDADGDRSTTTLTLTVEDIDLVADDEQAVVYEAALDLFQTGNDLAPGTVTGSVPGSTQETATGTLNIPGATSFSITGSTTGIYGLISIDDAGNYVYTLTSPVDNLPNANDGQDTELAGDVFTYAASDANGNAVEGTITIDIVDDIPRATNDFNAVEEFGFVEGNVLPNDAFSADGPDTTSPAGGLVGVRAADGNTTTPVTTGAGAVIAGLYGTLTLRADGSYSYQAGGVGENVQDVFVYTIRDSDGDLSTTTLTINILNEDEPPIHVPPTGGDSLALIVDEAGLDTDSTGDDDSNDIAPGSVDGSTPDALTETDEAPNELTFTAGTDAFTSIGFAPVANQTGITVSGLEPDYYIVWELTGGVLVGTLVLDPDGLDNGDPATEFGEAIRVELSGNTGPFVAGGTTNVSVKATLTGPLENLNPDDPQGPVQITGIAVVTTEADLQSVTGTVNVTVIDDTPSLNIVEDSDSVQEGQSTNGTWTLNPGADGVTSVDVTVGATTKSLQLDNNANEVTFNTAEGDLAVGADGTWDFTANTGLTQPISLSFTIATVDGDGDPTSDNLTITITDGASPGVTGKAELNVHEAGLDTDSTGDNDSNDIAAGSVDGTDPDATTETDVHTDALTFMAGSDAITSIDFAPIVDQTSISVSGLEDGYYLEWTLSSDILIGTMLFDPDGADTGVDPVEIGEAIRLQLSGDTGGAAAGNTADITVKATLTGPVEHDYPNAIQGPVEITGIRVVSTEADAEEAVGLVDVTVHDDEPVSEAKDTNAPMLILDETATGADPDAGDGVALPSTSVMSAVSFGTLFETVDYGADGPGSTGYTLELNTDDIGSGLFALGTGGAMGDEIVLAKVGANVIGYVTNTANVYFTISVNNTPGVDFGKVTFAQTQNVWHANTGSDDDTSALTLNGDGEFLQIKQTVTDGDNDSVSDTFDLSTGVFKIEDDGPTVTGEAASNASVAVDESDLAQGSGSIDIADYIQGTDADVGDGTLPTVIAASSNGSLVTATPDYGTDGAADTGELLYSFADLTSATTSVRTTEGTPITLVKLSDTVVVGVIDVANDDTAAFALEINQTTGEVTVEQYVSLTQLTPGDGTNPANSHDEPIDLSSSSLAVQVTVKDGDDDTATLFAPVNIGSQISFEDDGPSVVGSDTPPPMLVLDESSDDGADPDGENAAPEGTTSVMSAISFVDLFSNVDFGNDGPDGASFTLELSANEIGSGMFALGVNGAQGPSILLSKVGDDIVGHVGDPNVGANIWFTISVNNTAGPDFGKVTFSQSKNVWHSNTDDDDDTSALTLDGTTQYLRFTITDGDDDTASDFIDLSTDVFKIEDDGPTVTALDTSAPMLILDETATGTDPDAGDGVALPSTSVTSAVSFGTLFSVIDYGTDGPGSTSYALELNADGIGSGLFALGVGGAKGDEILLAKVGANIIGYVTNTANVYFTISVNNTPGVDLGKVTFAQAQNVWHTNTASDDDTSTLTLNGDGEYLQIRQTVTDADGDSESETFDLSTGVFKIEDDGPTFTADVQDQRVDSDTSDVPNSIATGTLHFDPGTDVAGPVGTISLLTGGLNASGGGTVVTAQIDNVLWGFVESGNNPGTYNVGEDTPIFSLSVNPSAGASGQYVFDLIGQLEGSLIEIDIATEGAFGNGPSDSVVVTVDGSDIVYVTGWNPTGSFVEGTWFTGGAADATLANNLQGSSSGWGLGNNNFDAGEFIRFDFGVLDDYGSDGGYTPPGSTGPMVSAEYATLAASNQYGKGDIIKYVAHYTDGSYESQESVFDDGDPPSVTFTAPAGEQIAWIDAYASNGTIKLDLGVVGVRSEEVDTDLTFQVTLTDGDLDPVQSDEFDVRVVDGGVPLGLAAPIIFDLDSDGAEFLSQDAGVAFDYGTGLVATAWVGVDDGILVHDTNGDGLVNSASEFVFGGAVQTDLEALAARYGDTLDAGDTDFAHFAVWQDANGNGVSEAGEVTTLQELGIVSIGLVSDGEGYTAGNGDVIVFGEAQFARADGSTGTVADAAFSTGQARLESRTQEMAMNTIAAGIGLTILVDNPDAASFAGTSLRITADPPSSEVVQAYALSSAPVEISAISSAQYAAGSQDSHETGTETSGQPLDDDNQGGARLTLLADPNDQTASADNADVLPDTDNPQFLTVAAGTADSAMMEQLLILADTGAEDATASATPEFGTVSEILADGDGEAFVDAIVDKLGADGVAGGGDTDLADLLNNHVTFDYGSIAQGLDLMETMEDMSAAAA